MCLVYETNNDHYNESNNQNIGDNKFISKIFDNGNQAVTKQKAYYYKGGHSYSMNDNKSTTSIFSQGLPKPASGISTNNNQLHFNNGFVSQANNNQNLNPNLNGIGQGSNSIGQNKMTFPSLLNSKFFGL